MDIEPALEDSNKDLEANNDEDFYVRGTRTSCGNSFINLKLSKLLDLNRFM